MTTALEDILDSRPRIRRDVLFTEMTDGVLFHNAQGGFRVTGRSAYRFASMIVPHLTGEHRLAELCAGLPDTQRRMVTDLVGKLLDRGFARSASAPDTENPLSPEVASCFAAQLNYVDHFQNGATERFARFRDTRVAILGDDAIARWCALSLLRNGCAHLDVLSTADPLLDRVRAEARDLTSAGAPAEIALRPAEPDPADWSRLDGADVVVCAGPAAPRQVFALLSDGIPEGRSLLPVTLLDGTAVVGPLSSSDEPTCWVCAMLRLGAGGLGAEAARAWSRVCLPETSVRGAVPSDNLAAMIGNLVGYEVFRLATGALPPETRDRLVLQDLDSMDTTSEQILPHPRCPFCAARPSSAAVIDHRTIDPTPPTMTIADTAEAADDLLAELSRQSSIVGAAGVITRFDDDETTQTPVKVSAVSLGIDEARRRTVAAFDVHHVAGARLRASRTGLAVYGEHVVPLPEVLSDTAIPQLPKVDAGRLVTASGLTAEPTGWVVASSLLTGDRVLVPAGAVRTLGIHNRDRAFLPSSAGTGAGSSLSEAIHHGLFSVLSYAALTQAVRGARPATMVDLAGLDDSPELRFLVRSAANLDVPVELLDLGDNILLARADAGRWAVACDVTWRRAAVAALRDLLGTVQLGRELPDGTPPDTGDPLLPGLAADALAVTGSSTPPDTVSALPEMLEDQRVAGRDVLAVDTTSADLRRSDLYTVRILLTS